jgi:hypothetical protein
MLCREVLSPQPELVEPIFYTQLLVRILAIYVGEFRDNIIKLETFEVQKFDDVAFVESHRNATFQFYLIYFIVFPASFAHGDPTFSHNLSISRDCLWTPFGASWERETP